MIGRRFLALALLLLFTGCSSEPDPGEFPQFAAWDAPDDKGETIEIAFTVPRKEGRDWKGFAIERATSPDGTFRKVADLGGNTDVKKPKKTLFTHSDNSDTLDTYKPERGTDYYYRIVGTRADGTEVVTEIVGPITARAEWWNVKKLSIAIAVIVFSFLVFLFIGKAKRDPDIYVREIGGLAAISEAIGRATEMGRPVLYVAGIAGMDDIQTITSLVIMREVAKETAEYETEMIVPCRDPVVMTGAEEAVRTGFMEAGKPDLYKSDNVRFLSDEQFAFTAATNGIMLREKTAANIYIGAFWAESLILAETGFLGGAIQIAGTANVSQLPFFVAACDYTLIGEEIYAASAYLSKEPMLLGSLKGSDWAKFIFAATILVGVVVASHVGALSEPVLAQTAPATEARSLAGPWEFGAPEGMDGPKSVRLVLEGEGGDVAVDEVLLVLIERDGETESPPDPILENAGFAEGLDDWTWKKYVDEKRNISLFEDVTGNIWIGIPDGSTVTSKAFTIKPGDRLRVGATVRQVAGPASLRISVVPGPGEPLWDAWMKFHNPD